MLIAMLALVFSCQKPELVEDELDTDTSVEAVTGRVPITFSAVLPYSPATKAMDDEINSMHLVLFDQEGMLVEVCQAQSIQEFSHTGHNGEHKYSVTLTVTDEPRIIHFIANCPVDQIIYGHEISVIGNLYVQNNVAAYWARTEVDNIMVDKVIDGENVHYIPKEDIISKFQCVPMLRNYSQISVTDATGSDDDFDFLGFTIYNTVEKGTVAPYNSKNQTFQNFMDEYGQKYSYPDMMELAFPYEGHALASADLNNKLIMKDGTYGEYGTYGKGENVKFYGADNAEKVFMMYERKVSVKTNDEDKWKESPPHVIIMGEWKSNKYFYKVDLVYDVMDDNGTPDDKTDDIVKEVKYYNILRNFSYNFTVSDVAGPGFETIEEAINGATGNNLSGSATTAKFTNISNNEGRLWVSYTDTTLVTNNNITLKYKYLPNINKPEAADYGQPNNDLVQLENTVGEVISGFGSYDNGLTYKDITGGAWDGYREVTFKINQPGNTSFEQVVAVKTNNANLARDIRYYLKKKFEMDVVCSPKVEGRTGVPVEIDVHLPLGLTEDMFPLKLDMEVADMTLSPDSDKNVIPVSTGKSVIPLEQFKDKKSFNYRVTIETLDDYKNLNTVGNQKCFRTYWITNAADNASTMYVVNKYFALAYDDWENYKYEFSNLSCTASEVGVEKNVSISFSMDTDDAGYQREVTVSLVGMTYNGQTSFKYTPNTRNETINGLKTTTEQDKVSFTLDANEYAIASAEGERQTYKFNGAFMGVTTLQMEDEAEFQFNIPADAYYDGMTVYVTLDRLVPADDEENLEYVIERAVGDRYLYRVENSGIQTIKLATAEPVSGECSVTLEAPYFDTETISISQKLLQFRDLTMPARVTQGTGRNVNITFKLAEGDISDRIVTVTLVNMTINGSTTYKFNTAENTPDRNGNYTINAVTSHETGDLKVTLSADGYDDDETTCSDRPAPEKTETISFANDTQRESQSNSQQVWSNGSITLTNDRNGNRNNRVTNNTNPVRFYSGQKVTIDAGGNQIVKIVFYCNSNTYANNLMNAIGSAATKSGNNITVTLDGTTSYVITLTNEVRLNSLEVTYQN